ncbi:hypothetical protein BH09MYX1_BH09MYX1_68140 [soil metagenome]
MAAKKYPLEKLKELRDHRVDEAGTALAGAVRARTAAEIAEAKAAAERAAAEERARAVRHAEANALNDGSLSAADLQRAQAWEHRVEAERRELTEKEDAERTKADAARTGEQDARGELAVKQADAKVIETDRERHLSRVRREAEAKAEEEANEAWRKR